MSTVRDTFSGIASDIEKMKDGYMKISELNSQFNELVEKLNAQLGGSIEFSQAMKELILFSSSFARSLSSHLS